MILEMQDILYKTCDEYYSMMSNLQKYYTWILIKHITFTTLSDPSLWVVELIWASLFL